MIIPSVETPRLTLRAFTADDLSPLHVILNGPDVLRYFPRSEPLPPERVQVLIAKMLAHWEDHGYGLWGVELRSTGELLGRCGLQRIPETNETEIDFLLGRSCWGQGYATEAGRATLRYGFETLRAGTVVGIVHPGNAASRRVLEKLGFAITRPAVYFGMDCIRYAIEPPWVRHG